jgi:hypothetical protein
MAGGTSAVKNRRDVSECAWRRRYLATAAPRHDEDRRAQQQMGSGVI